MEYDEEVPNKWREIRARVDSLINEVFLISGGALAVSVTALLGLWQSSALIPKVQCIASFAWFALIATILSFILLKGLLIWQSYQECTAGNKKHLRKTNRLAWLLGIFGTLTFITGMCLMVYSATIIIGHNSALPGSGLEK